MNILTYFGAGAATGILNHDLYKTGDSVPATETGDD